MIWKHFWKYIVVFVWIGKVPSRALAGFNEDKTVGFGFSSIGHKEGLSPEVHSKRSKGTVWNAHLHA